MKKLLLLIIVSLAFASIANAATIQWQPVEDANTPGFGNWNVVTNWDLGSVPTTDDYPQLGDLIGCLIDSDTDAVCTRLAVGDNGGNDVESVLTIEGSLTTSTPDSWSTAGYNRSATINVERGAVFTNGWRIGVGLVSSNNPTVPSVLNVNGGLVTIGQNLQIGTVGNGTTILGHIGIVNVNSGTLETENWQWRDTTGIWSFMDVSHGTVIINADVTELATDLIGIGALTGFGQAGNVEAVYANGATTITAIADPLARSPEMDDVVSVGDVTLSWINLDPNGLATSVDVEVYFGTDLNDMSLLTSGTDLTSAVFNAPVYDEYIWRVDTNRNGGEVAPYVQGETMYFIASDDIPPAVAMDTVPTATWIDEPVQLDITVTDDGKSTVTYLWEASDPNAIFVIPGTLTEDNTIEDPEVICDYHAAQFTVTVTVSDSNPLQATADATVGLDCAETACQASRGPANLADAYLADIDGDCNHNMADFAEFAKDWMLDYAIKMPTDR